MLNFQQMIAKLTEFWTKQGCIVHQGYDLEVGAGTFNPATFLRSLGPEPYSAVYVEPSRRPKDGRYGENPNRVQFYHQMQVIMKPSPPNIQELYLESLKSVGLDLSKHDIRFVHDDWENPTIGAWGLGWEIWLDGMEVTQFTYFQAVGGLPVKPVSGEITYGLERLAMYLQGVDSLFDIQWNDEITYGDVFKRSEWEWSHYNFHEADDKMWLRHFEDFEQEAKRLIQKGFPIPAFDFVMKASHSFNILDARGVISVTERTGYIARIRQLARLVAEEFVKSREKINFPLMKNEKQLPPIPEKSIGTFTYDPKKKEDFLLEIGSEELPATFVPIGSTNLENALSKLLSENGLEFESIKTFATPRRLSCYVQGLSQGTESQKIEKKGPTLQAAFSPSGEPTEIGKGFLRSVGFEPMSLDACKKRGAEIRKIKESDYLFVTYEKKGISTKELLSSSLPTLILNIDFPKKMRWGNLDIEYARPIRWIVAIFGNEVIPFHVGPIVSGKTSRGHRQLDPGTFEIKTCASYADELKKHHVMADVEERKKEIQKLLQGVEKKTNTSVVATERVMPQVLHLVEWPFVEVGSFDAKFLKCPKEVLISEMVEHQRYFPLAKSDGTLAPQFVIICNNTPQENIRKGNEKALSPRLSDGLFLYEEDLNTPLTGFNEKLKTVTFQKELGSMSAKVERLSSYLAVLHTFLPKLNMKNAEIAAKNCKADLVSLLVGEFPELQGIAGHIFAKHAGINPESALAIEEHWMPRGEKAPLPSSEPGVILSIADKIDNLLSCFSLGLIPTSSSDPYALRRQTLGIIKMVIENKFTFPLRSVFEKCFEQFLKNKEMADQNRKEMSKRKEEILNQVEEFFLSRARSVFAEYGFAKDEVESVLSHGLGDIYDRFLLLEAIHTLRKTNHEEFLALLTLGTRTRKILHSQKEVKLEKVDPSLLKESAEKTLFSKIETIRKEPLKDYRKAFLQLTELEKPLEALFDGVKILDDDSKLRNNRLSLLREVLSLCDRLIDFSKIQEHEKG